MMHSRFDTYMELSLTASLKAGEAIMEIYGKPDFGVELKADRSPLTVADRKSHQVIESILSATGLPILSEEGKDIPFETRKDWDLYWLVDPLDGTKEFISRNGEFTVNIALIYRQKPVMGIIYAPVLDLLYAGMAEKGSFRMQGASQRPSLWDQGAVTGLFESLPVEQHRSTFVAAASRSNSNDKTRLYIESLKKEHGEVEFLSRGSSLKLCLIAEGSADVYPRFGPTYEWDTAAGQAIVEHSGGTVMEAGSGKPLRYNKESLLNPEFIALGYRLTP
jgi:3'(2'), 5'-bisphosphate nucleotidase